MPVNLFAVQKQKNFPTPVEKQRPPFKHVGWVRLPHAGGGPSIKRKCQLRQIQNSKVSSFWYWKPKLIHNWLKKLNISINYLQSRKVVLTNQCLLFKLSIKVSRSMYSICIVACWVYTRNCQFVLLKYDFIVFWTIRISKQEVHGPHRSPEKLLQINKQKWLYNNVD